MSTSYSAKLSTLSSVSVSCCISIEQSFDRFEWFVLLVALLNDEVFDEANFLLRLLGRFGKDELPLLLVLK